MACERIKEVLNKQLGFFQEEIEQQNAESEKRLRKAEEGKKEYRQAIEKYFSSSE